MEHATHTPHPAPRNKGKVVGQKALFKLKEVWAIRGRHQMEHSIRELALFDLGIDSKLRGCDRVELRVRDVCHGEQVAGRAIVMQQKTQRPVQFEITPPTREAVHAWINVPVSSPMTTCSRAGFTAPRTSAPGITHAFSNIRWRHSGSIRPVTAPTRCAEPRSR